MKKNHWMLTAALTGMLTLGAADVVSNAKAFRAQVTPDTVTYKAPDGWLYSRKELEFLTKGDFRGEKIAKLSACAKAKNVDPLPALTHFNAELKKLGIRLIVVPIPPKAAVHPLPGIPADEAVQSLKLYYETLRSAGLEVLDLCGDLQKSQVPSFCRTDSRWSPAGVAIAARRLAEIIPLRGSQNYTVAAKTAERSGDLARSLSMDNPEKESFTFQVVSGKTADHDSPVLLIGDSFAKLYSTGGDMLCENAGLAEQLALNLKMPVDTICIKGSGSSAPRVLLYRGTVGAAQWLRDKKVVVYCFDGCDFTESAIGWIKAPVICIDDKVWKGDEE